MICPLCGCEFDAADADRACRGCVLHRNCELVRCPRCGYETFPETRLGLWMKGLFSMPGEAAENDEDLAIEKVIPLADLQPGRRGCVMRFHRANGSTKHYMKLMAMGLYPGASIELVRRSPTFVYRSGFSEFAIDRELAELVIIRFESEVNQA